MAVMLNNDMRVVIRKNAMEGAYVAQLKQARKDLHAVAAEVHEAAFAKIPFKAIPDIFLRAQQDFRIHLPRIKGKKQEQIHIDGAFYHGYKDRWELNQDDYETEDPAPAFIVPSNDYVLKLADYPVSLTLQAKLSKAYATLCELELKRHKMDQNINAILQSVRSVNQLLEVWPDCDSYLPVIASTESKSLTVRVDDMSKELLASKHGD
jgi:hypothetical protein